MAELARRDHGTFGASLARWVPVAAWAAAAFWAVAFFGVLDLTTLLGFSPYFSDLVPLETSWGVFFTLLVAGSFAWIARRPRDMWPAIVQLGIAVAALVVSSIAGADVRPLPVAAGVSLLAGLLIWLDRDHAPLFPLQRRLSWPHLALALVGMPVWILYSFAAASMSRLGIDDDVSWGVGHWPIQAAAGLSVAGCSLVMAYWPPSHTLLRITLSLSAALLGVSMLAYPAATGAMGHPLWGILMVGWGMGVALLEPLSSLKDRVQRAA